MPEANQPQLLLSEWNNQITTRSGVRLNVRPAAPEDEALLAEFFGRVTPDDLRFRFLSPVKKAGHDLVSPLVEVDHTTTENFLAFADDGETLVATAMIAADPSLERAEVAIAVRSDFKHRGLGWSLLQLVADYARARGIKSIESIEPATIARPSASSRRWASPSPPIPATRHWSSSARSFRSGNDGHGGALHADPGRRASAGRRRRAQSLGPDRPEAVVFLPRPPARIWSWVDIAM